MSMVKPFNFTLVRGTTKPLRFTARNADGTPKDLTGAFVYAAVRPDIKADAVISLTSNPIAGIVIATQSGATLGQFTITFTPTMTPDTMPLGTYVWDAEILTLAGEVFPMLALSTIELVARSTSIP